MYINYLNQDLRVSTDMHEEPQKIAISIKICTNRMYNNQISLSKDYNKVKHI